MDKTLSLVGSVLNNNLTHLKVVVDILCKMTRDNENKCCYCLVQYLLKIPDIA